MANEYSRQWFSTFMDTLPERWTRSEVLGVTRRLPLPEYARILDICCGTGRHAALLSADGYQVTGVDRDEDALDQARVAAPAARFLPLDQRDLRELGGPFDGAIILWQSFGYYDSETNDRILTDIASLLRVGGRLLLDLFHPAFFSTRQGVSLSARSEARVSITNTLRGDRLLSRIEYTDGATETMDFELFAPQVLVERAHRCGFDTIEQCCWWEEGRDPDPDVQRYQTVLQRR